MDKLEAGVRIFECLCNNHFNNIRITDEQRDELINTTIKIVEKLI